MRGTLGNPGDPRAAPEAPVDLALDAEAERRVAAAIVRLIRAERQERAQILRLRGGR